jgi:hypothetical protein
VWLRVRVLNSAVFNFSTSSRNPAFLGRCDPGQLGEFADHRLRLRKRHVAFERIFRGDGLCGSVRHHFTLVDTARQVDVATEAAFERGQVEPPQIRDFGELLVV